MEEACLETGSPDSADVGTSGSTAARLAGRLVEYNSIYLGFHALYLIAMAC